MGDFNTTLPGAFGVERLKASELEILRKAIDVLTSAWSTWTPTLTNLAAGSTPVVARYRRLGKTVDWYFRWIWSAGASVGTDPSFTLPYAPASHYPVAEGFGGFPGIVRLVDAGTTTRQGGLFLSSGSTVAINFWNATPAIAQITSTAPWTWTTSDSMTASGTYQTT